MHDASHKRQAAELVFKQRQIRSAHMFQFYADYGVTQDGPWAKIGLNDVEYIVGYIPKAIPKPRIVPVEEAG